MASIFLGSVYGTLEMQTAKWSSEINKAKGELDKLDGHVSGKMASIGQSFTNTGKALTLGLTIPLTLFGKAAVDIAVEIETKWKEVEKVYGSVAGSFVKDQKMLEESVDSLSVKFGSQKSATLDALGALAAMGYEGSDAIKMLEASMGFAITGQMDLNTAMTGAVAISKIYNVQGEELTKTLALLNSVENATGASMSDLNEAIGTAGSSAQVAKVGVRELSAMVAALRERAIPAGEAANALKTIFTRVYKVTEDATGVYEKYNITVDAGNGKLKSANEILNDVAKSWNKMTDAEKEAVIQSNAGVYQRNKFVALMQDLNSENSTYLKTLGAIGDATVNLTTYEREMAVFLDSSATKLASSKVAFDNMKVAIGAVILQGLVPLMNKLSELAKWFSGLNENTQKTIVIIGALVAGLGPVLWIFGHILTFLAGLPALIATVTTVLTGMFTFITATAIPAIVAFVAAFWPVILILGAVGVALYLLWKNWDEVSNWISQKWTWLTTSVTLLSQNLKTKLTSDTEGLSTYMKSTWTIMTEYIRGLQIAFNDTMTTAWNNLKNIISEATNLLWYSVRNYFNEGWNFLKNIGNSIFEAITKPFKDAWETIKDIVGKIVEKMKEISPFTRHSPSLVEQVTSGVKVIKSQYESLNDIKMPSMGEVSTANVTGVVPTVEPLGKSNIGSEKITNNSPNFTVNVGVYAGTEMEKRSLAKTLFDSYKSYLTMEGKQLVYEHI